MILLGLFPLFMGLCDSDRAIQAQFIVRILDPYDTFFASKYILAKRVNCTIIELLLLVTMRTIL